MWRREDVYRDDGVAGDNGFLNNHGDYRRFATSPVRNAYWGVNRTTGQYIWRDRIPENNRMNLEHRLVPYEMNVLLSSFLDIPPVFGVKRNKNHVILNDSWTVNLKSTRENVMMDAFLNGFGTQFENLKNQWCNTTPHTEKKMGIDVTDELKDIFKVYMDADAHLESKQKMALNHLVNAMESFLAVHKEKNIVASKLNTLKYKLKDNAGCDCDEEDEDGDDDE